jgi:peptide/nickel transport system substrate-binding protein
LKGKAGTFWYLIFLALALLTGLQTFTLIKNTQTLEKFSKSLNQLEKNIEKNQLNQNELSSKHRDFYPGDEGDWRVWGLKVEPKTLNPLSVERDIYANWIAVGNIFERLAEYDHQTLKMKPVLAKNFILSPDGKKITFTLRDDVYFTDGVKLTVEDVIFTYQTITDPLIDCADIAQLFRDVTGYQVDPPNKITFFLKRPYFKSLEILSFWDTGILPKHIYQYDDPAEFNTHNSSPVGSGPYIFEKWDVGDKIVLRRNENYWNKKPNIRKIIYKFITNDIASLQALRAGQIDMTIPTPEQFAQLCREPGFNEKFYCLKYWNPGVPFYYIGWNIRNPIFADKNVRLAMTHMIDRQRIVNALMKGNGKVVTGPFYINSGACDKSIKPWPCDLQKAAQLLEKAGWTDSDGDGIRDKDQKKLSFTFSYAVSSTLYRQIARMIKDDAEKIGVKITPQPFEWSVLITRITQRKFESMIMGWGGDILEDPYQLWHSSQADNRGSNYVGFKSQKADRIIETARTIYDENKRNQLYNQLHRILHDQQPYTFLFTRPTFRLVDKRFKNINIYRLGVKYEQWYVPEHLQKYK